jgi:hypothetical protein
MRTFPKSLAALSLIIALSCSFAAAGPLNLLQSDPDAYSQLLSISYTQSTGLFVVTGDFPYVTLDNNFDQLYPYDGTFSLTATIPNSAALNTPISLTSGSLTISGKLGNESDGVGTASDPVETFFSSSLPTEFAYSDPSNGSNPLFDFIFAGQGGTLLTPNQNIGLEIQAGGTMANFYPNFFTANFSNTGTAAVADTYNVPEPGALSLMGVGALGLLRRKRAA